MKFVLTLTALATFGQAFYVKNEVSLREQNGTARDCIIKQCDPQIKRCLANADCKKIIDGALEKCKGQTGDAQDRCQIREIATSRNKLAEDILRCGHQHQCLPPHIMQRQRDISMMPFGFIGNPAQCMRDHCMNEIKNCSVQVDPQCSQAFRNCERRCKDDQNPRNCMNKCVNDSGQPNAKAIIKCGDDNHCYDNVSQQFQEPKQFISFKDAAQCRKEHCSAQTAACDQPCQDALEKCDKKCGKNPFCWDSCISGCGNQQAKDQYGCCKKYHCY